MGKMPLAGLIGACSIGILLTGCNCCKQNTKQSYAGGKPETSLGLTKFNKPPNSSPLVSSTGTPGNSAALPSTPGGGGFDSSGAIGAGGNPSFNSSGISAPINGGLPPLTNGVSSPAARSGAGMPVSSSFPGMGSNGSSMTDNSTTTLAGNGPYTGTSGADNVRRVSSGFDDSTNPGLQTVRYDASPGLPMKSGGGTMVPPVPATPIPLPSSSIPPPSSSMPPPSSSMPSSTSMDPPPYNPAPKVTPSSASSGTGFGMKTSIGPSNLTPLPSSLQN